MRPGADEVQLVADDTVDEQPVRLEVGIPVALPVAPQRMILVLLRQRLANEQQRDHLA